MVQACRTIQVVRLHLPVAKSIYGADNRLDLYAADPEERLLADSVVSLWHNEEVKPEKDGSVYLQTRLYGDRQLNDAGMKLCAGERFAEQPTGAFCSGSLVGPDLVMTAGHCIETPEECAGTKVIFGFAIDKAGGSAPSTLPATQVYSCKSIVTRLLTGEPGSPVPPGQKYGPDYALIRLDRPVTDHKPLRVNKGQQLKNGDPMLVIGHPVGLPLKVAGGSTIRDASLTGYFVTDLDTFGGNSGSPVFNAVTRLVEGILVRGAEDFSLPPYDFLSYFSSQPKRCLKQAVFAQDGDRGEDVTRVSLLENFIWNDPGAAQPPKLAGFRNVNPGLNTAAETKQAALSLSF